MAVLRATGITFSDTSQLNSKFGIIPKTSTMSFFQAAAPVGWAKTTTHNNKAFRVVSGVGSATGGITSFTTAFPGSVITVGGVVSAAATVGGHTLTIAQIPSHAHAAGSSSGAFQAGPALPSRYSTRTPIAYGFRAPYRQPVANRTPTNYRQPTTYRQPSSFRQQNLNRVPQVNRVPIVYRQPNQIRVPQANRVATNYRQPFSFRQPNNVRAVRNYRQPIANRQPNRVPARVNLNDRTPRAIPYRNPQGGNPNRQPNPNERRFETRIPSRVASRQVQRNALPARGRPIANRRQGNRINQSTNQRNPQRLAQPFNNRVPFLNGNSRLPNIRNYRQPAPVRQPNRVPDRTILNYRVPSSARYIQSNRNIVSGRTPIQNRNIQNSRVTQDNRVPIVARTPSIVRVVQDSRVLINQRNIVPQRVITPQRNILNSRVDLRYPGVSDVRYISRVLVPGGTIRADNTSGPDTSLVGSDQSHSHTFTSNSVPYNFSLDLRVQYIDIILCNFVG
jgi:hypothetical protein